MQTNLFNNTDDSKTLSSVNEPPIVKSGNSARHDLETMISVCGMSVYKDYYMKIKNGLITHIPEGYTKSQFLMLAKDVFESRAQRITRTKRK